MKSLSNILVSFAAVNAVNGATIVNTNVPIGVQIMKCTKPNTVAITFDDGPSTFTEHLLDVLSQRQVKSTFFLVGTEMARFPSTVKRMYNEGHQVAGHTNTHLSLDKSTSAQIHSEIDLMNQRFVEILGFTPNYFRCPYGECMNPASLAVLAEYKLHVIQWDDETDTLDWDHPTLYQPNLEVYTKAVASGKANMGIFLNHDIVQMTVDHIAEVIDILQKAGLTLTTVADCLGDTILYSDGSSGVNTGSNNPPATGGDTPATGGNSANTDTNVGTIGGGSNNNEPNPGVVNPSSDAASIAQTMKIAGLVSVVVAIVLL